MQGVSKRGVRRLGESLAVGGWACTCGDVLQPRAHLQRQRERRRQFAHPGADRLHAEHDMVVGARDDAHEAVVALQRQRAAAGAERETGRRDLAAPPRAASGDRPTLTTPGR